MAARGTLDQRRDRSTSVDRVEHGPPDPDQDTCGIKKNYNGWIGGDVAASHASIAWKQGAPEINQTRDELNGL